MINEEIEKFNKYYGHMFECGDFEELLKEMRESFNRIQQESRKQTLGEVRKMVNQLDYDRYCDWGEHIDRDELLAHLSDLEKE